MRRLTFLSLALILPLAGCAAPERQGPQVPKLPNGLAYDGNISSARVVFPDRERGHQRGYMTLTEPSSSVVITEFPGTSDRDEIAAARQALADRYGYLEYGPLEELKIDGRRAWGWLETQNYRGALASLEYKAVVPYDDVTYSVEFFTGDERYRNEAFLREAVCRFEIGRTKVNEAAVTAGFVMAFLFAAGWMFLTKKSS